MRHYATTAAAAHLPQLRVLHASMQRHCSPFRLHVLAEGPEVERWAREQADVAVLHLEALLEWWPEARPDRLPGPPRNGNELACCWRWLYLWCLADIHGYPVTAVDADVMFWSSPEPVFEEIGDAPAAVVPHGFAPMARGLPGVTLESHGRFSEFNGGFAYFASAKAARRMYELARECSHAADHHWPDDRTTWGDQGALSLIREEFGAHVIQAPVNVGPWGIHGQALEREADGTLTFGGRALISYHFHSLRPSVQLADANYGISARQAELLYQPYLASLAALK